MKTFPMFLCVANRPVIIVGGGEQAAQKCRLMLKTEADIVVAWPQLDAELLTLALDGKISWHNGPVTKALFDGAALVFIATGCRASSAALGALAKAAGVVVNVVDHPDLCTAFTPSIVDRDPVVVAIGTEGTAPVLGRQIKSQIEIMLDPSLGRFSAMAGKLREKVARHVPPTKRRAFWSWVFEGSPRSLHRQGDEVGTGALIGQAIRTGTVPGHDESGAICLIQADPGAADLLTLRALKRLQEADVIFHDRLVDPAVLELARRDAERVVVPKGVERKAKITRLIIETALSGKTVLRLKSADSEIFCAANEVRAIADMAGIRAEIVPGILTQSPKRITKTATPSPYSLIPETGLLQPAMSDRAGTPQPENFAEHRANQEAPKSADPLPAPV